MISMAELGYDVAEKVTIESPWGKQDKPAGQDAYLVFDEGKDQYYMVNIDAETGYPIKYVPAAETSAEEVEEPAKPVVTEKKERTADEKEKINELNANDYVIIPSEQGPIYADELFETLKDSPIKSHLPSI